MPKAYVVAGRRATSRRARPRTTSCATLATTSLPYQRIRRIEFFDLPKTISGKIRRVELRGLEDDAASDGVRRDAEYRYEDFPELRS